jgi:hypothetical protein
MVAKRRVLVVVVGEEEERDTKTGEASWCWTEARRKRAARSVFMGREGNGNEWVCDD